MTQIHQNSKLYKLRVSHSLDFTLGMAAPPVRDCGKSATRIKRHREWLGLTLHEWLSVETDTALIERLQSGIGRLDFETAVDLFNSWESQVESYIIAGETTKASRLQELLSKLAERIGSLPASDSQPSIGLSDATNYHTNGQQESLIENSQRNQGFQKRVKRGSKGISPAAKRRIRSCGLLLEEQYQLKNLAFVTCTLPALDESQLRQICSKWSAIVRDFFQSLTRFLVRKGLSADYVQVTEIQEKRFKRWGQVCPHLHFVCQSRLHRREQWRISPDDIKFIWQRALRNALGVKLDCTAATRIENPRRSLGKELGKYLSKGGKVVREILDCGLGEFLPSAWYGMSRALSRLERSKRIECVGEVAAFLLRHLDALSRSNQLCFRRIYAKFKCPLTGVESENCVGITGWFTSRSALMRVLNLLSAPESNRNLAVI